MLVRDPFSEYHPLVCFVFFGIVFCFSMLSMHPVCLLISLCASVCYYICLKGAKAAGLLFKGALPVLLLTSIINPLFSHAGQTILWYFPSGNPLTLESILYGIAAGIMLASVLVWFACFSVVMTSEKLVCLFGRFAPALSLLLSMTLRFLPRFKKQFDAVRETQKAFGRDASAGKLKIRIKTAILCFSAVVTRSLENAIDTSDSMKSRGYGIKRRKAYTIYRISERDKTMLAVLLFCAVFFVNGGLSGSLSWRFYPNIRGVLTDPLTIVLEIVYCLFCFLPVILSRKEEWKWKHLRSNI